jgi:hypothetical protein
MLHALCSCRFTAKTWYPFNSGWPNHFAESCPPTMTAVAIASHSQPSAPTTVADFAPIAINPLSATPLKRPSHDIWDGTYYPKPRSGNSRTRLIERKQMSTKTTFKRVALVAVASLGFGVLSSVAPASAAEAAGLTTAINGVALTTNTNAISSNVSLAVGMTTAEGAAATITAPTVTLSAKVTSYPVGGAANITAAAATAADTAGDANLAGTMTYVQTAPYASCVQTGANDAVTAVGTTTGTAAGAGFCKLTFTPAVAGTYIVTVWRDYANVGAINDNEVSQTFSFTVVAAGAVIGNQFPNSADTTAGVTGASLAGVKVSSVGIETVQVSGRTGIQVGFAPQYRLTRNAAAAAIVDASGVSNATKFANIAYSVTNPAGTAVTVVSAQEQQAGHKRDRSCISQQQLLVHTQLLRSTMQTLILW